MEGMRAQGMQSEFAQSDINLPRLAFREDGDVLAAPHLAVFEQAAKTVDPFAFDAIGLHGGYRKECEFADRSRLARHDPALPVAATPRRHLVAVPGLRRGS